MRIPSSVDRSSLQFNITPLIDVVFQLIIFFLVASYFVKNEVNEPVQLPEATQRDEEEEETPRRIVITVAADESWFLGNIPTTLAEIERRIADGADKHGPDFEVRLRGDRAVPFSAVEPVMVACAKAGVQRLKFAVEFRK